MIKEFESEVIENNKLTPDTSSIIFNVPDKFDFKAGQYLLLGVPINHPKLKGKELKGTEGSNIRRAYSIVNAPSTKGKVELCVKRVEEGTLSGFICDLQKGEKVGFMGPIGHFLIKERDKDIVFIAVGAGIAPFVGMITDLLENGFEKKIVLIKGARREEDKLYDDLFIELKEKYENFDFHNVLSRPNEDFENKGYVQHFIEKCVENSDSYYYICGLQDMIEGVKDTLKENGVPSNDIFYEKYD